MQSITNTRQIDRNDYAPFLWRRDRSNANMETPLPEKFRTMLSPLSAPPEKYALDASYQPSLQGFHSLNASGSGQFVRHQLRALASEIRQMTDGRIFIVDLRQESHFFLNELPISHYGKNNWANVGLSADEIMAGEELLLSELSGSQIEAFVLKQKTKEPYEPVTIRVDRAITERELVEQEGLCYVRIPCTDHIFPETDSVEALIALTKEMEEGDWLHFHCVAGKGRSTALFAVYDILKNPGVPLKDILYRQCMLGGNYMLFQGDGGWKDPYYLGKAEMTQKFYRYVQENHETGYRVRWTEWLAAQGCA